MHVLIYLPILLLVLTFSISEISAESRAKSGYYTQISYYFHPSQHEGVAF